MQKGKIRYKLLLAIGVGKSPVTVLWINWSQEILVEP